MKKSVALTIFGIMAAVIIGVGVYSWTLDSRLGDSSRVASAYSGGAMGEFTGALTELDEAMRESRYATDSTILSALCAKASANAASAVTALASLPYSTQELEVLAQYLNGTGDYTLYLSKEAAEGRMLSASELENLSQLSDAVREISAQTSGIFAALDAGDLTMDEYGANSDGAVSGTVGYELAALNAALDEFPELEYSGRYSSSVMGAPAAYLEGQDAVSENRHVRRSRIYWYRRGRAGADRTERKRIWGIWIHAETAGRLRALGVCERSRGSCRLVDWHLLRRHGKDRPG